MSRYLIAYDIADPRRLQRVARRLERSAIRVQKSVFFAELPAPELESLLEQLDALIAPREDVIQAWALRQGLKTVRRTLCKARLKLRESKTQVGPLKQGVRWLGVDLAPRTAAWSEETRYGYRIPDEKCARMVQTIQDLTAVPHEKFDPSTFNAGRWIHSVNEQLRQWRESYRYSDNAREVWAVLDDNARAGIGRVLRKLTGLRGNRLNKTCRVKLPRGFWTWRMDGVQLVNLSSEAPRCPAGLTRKPHWQTSRRQAA